MPKLTSKTERSKAAEFQFQDAVVVGRGDTSDWSSSNPSVSRRHAKIVWRNGQCHVQDLGSGNGTFVNERLISQPTRLKGRRPTARRIRPARLHRRDVVLRRGQTPRVRYVDPPGGSQVLLRVPAQSGAQTPSDESMLGAARRVRFLEDLARISTMVFDERALMSFVVDEMFEMMPQAERVFVMLWDAELQRFVSTEARTRAGHSTEVVASRTLLQEVLARREAVLVVDAHADAVTARPNRCTR